VKAALESSSIQLPGLVSSYELVETNFFELLIGFYRL